MTAASESKTLAD